MTRVQRLVDKLHYGFVFEMPWGTQSEHGLTKDKWTEFRQRLGEIAIKYDLDFKKPAHAKSGKGNYERTTINVSAPFSRAQSVEDAYGEIIQALAQHNLSIARNVVTWYAKSDVKLHENSLEEKLRNNSQN